MRIEVSDPNSIRLDVYLSQQNLELSRSRIQSLIKSKHILLNGSPAKAKSPLKSGDQISIDIPPPESSTLQPQDLPLQVLYEDSDLIVLNKAAGMVVHPAAGHPNGTLVNALLHHCKGQLGGIGGVERPGIVHRLDKDTSGCLIAAKTDHALQHLLDQFANRSPAKYYLALTESPPTPLEGRIETLIGRHPVNRQKMAVISPDSSHPSARKSLTYYRTLYQDPDNQSSLVLCKLETGRTHQIRVHLKHLKAPLLGDPIYAKPSQQAVQLIPPNIGGDGMTLDSASSEGVGGLGGLGRLGLHSWRLSLQHPSTQEQLFFEAPLPSEFETLTNPIQPMLLELSERINKSISLF